MPRSRNEIGILLSFAGYSAWVAADVFVKLAAETFTIPQIFAMECTVGLFLIPFIAHFDGGYRQLASRRPWFQLLSSALVVSATVCAIAGVVYLSLADFYTIVFTSPLITTVLGRVFLKERPDRRIWLATIAGFIGVIIAVRFSASPGHTLSWIGILVTTGTAVTFSFAMLLVRAAPGETDYAFTFWPRVLGFICFVTFLVWQGHSFDWHTPRLIYPICVGIMGAMGGFLTNISLRYAPIAIVAPYHYTQIIGGAFMGYLIWHNVPAVSVMVGAVIVAGSGLFILRHQKHAADEEFTRLQT